MIFIRVNSLRYELSASSAVLADTSSCILGLMGIRIMHTGFGFTELYSLCIEVTKWTSSGNEPTKKHLVPYKAVFLPFICDDVNIANKGPNKTFSDEPCAERHRPWSASEEGKEGTLVMLIKKMKSKEIGRKIK